MSAGAASDDPFQPPRPAVSCVFICHDGAGRILLARRGAGARDEPGTWDSGAGALEYGETFEQAVTREVREEYSADTLEIETLGVRNVLRRNPVSHWVAIVVAIRRRWRSESLTSSTNSAGSPPTNCRAPCTRS